MAQINKELRISLQVLLTSWLPADTPSPQLTPPPPIDYGEGTEASSPSLEPLPGRQSDVSRMCVCIILPNLDEIWA